MATPPRERDIGTGNLEDGTKREGSTSFIDEIVDAPGADGAQVSVGFFVFVFFFL